MSAATLGSRVKAWRTELGLSQRDLPGIDSGSLSRIESGKAKDVGIETLQKLAKALGRTLEELAGAPASGVRSIPLRDLEADPDNPRTLDVGDSVDANFVESIRTQGLLQAVTVRPSPDAPGKWRIAFGGRRYAALVMIHGPKSKVVVAAKLATAEGPQLLLQQLAENVQRADMNPWDLARSIGALVEGAMDTQAIADALGRKRRWVQEQASIAQHLTDNGQLALKTGEISISQAVAVAGERDPEAQDRLCARAMQEKLNEDEIRAITADRKVKAATEKKAKDGQIDIEEVTGRPKKGYPVANENGVFEGKPDEVRQWAENKRGHLKLSVAQFGDRKWAGAYDYKWRAAGGSSPLSRVVSADTAGLAMFNAARVAFASIKRAAEGHPEDTPSLRNCHLTVGAFLRNMGATERVIEDWMENNAPPAPPKATKKIEPAAPPPEEPAPIVDLSTVPAWAAPMADALFVIHGTGPALLCRGWLHMAKTYAEEAAPNNLAALFVRDEWENDDEGQPDDYGSTVYRLVEAPQ